MFKLILLSLSFFLVIKANSLGEGRFLPGILNLTDTLEKNLFYHPLLQYILEDLENLGSVNKEIRRNIDKHKEIIPLIKRAKKNTEIYELDIPRAKKIPPSPAFSAYGFYPETPCTVASTLAIADFAFQKWCRVYIEQLVHILLKRITHLKSTDQKYHPYHQRIVNGARFFWDALGGAFGYIAVAYFYNKTQRQRLFISS